jgi:hypothetical protein
MIWRSDADHPGIDALGAAVDELASAEGWLSDPGDAWLPRPEAGHDAIVKP